MAYSFAAGSARGLVPSKSLRQFLRGFGARLERYMEQQSRSAEVARLQSKDDAELAQMGISRERIIAHVFRDRFVF